METGFLNEQFRPQIETSSALELARQLVMRSMLPWGLGALDQWEYRAVLTAQLADVASMAASKAVLENIASGLLYLEVMEKYGAEYGQQLFEILAVACHHVWIQSKKYKGNCAFRGITRPGGIKSRTGCDDLMALAAFKCYKRLPTGPMADIDRREGGSKPKYLKYRASIAEVNVWLEDDREPVPELTGELLRIAKEIQDPLIKPRIERYLPVLDDRGVLYDIHTLLLDEDLQEEITFVKALAHKGKQGELKDSYATGCELLAEWCESKLGSALAEVEDKVCVAVVDYADEGFKGALRKTARPIRKTAGGESDAQKTIAKAKGTESSTKEFWTIPAYELAMRTGLAAYNVFLEQLEKKPRLAAALVAIQRKYIETNDPFTLVSVTTKDILEKAGIKVNKNTERQAQRLLQNLTLRVNNGPIIHAKTLHTGNSGKGMRVKSWWNQRGYSMYHIMGFIKPIVEESGIGVRCPASYIQEKLITRYRLGTKKLENDGKISLTGIPLRTVSKYKKLMVEWGWL